MAITFGTRAPAIRNWNLPHLSLFFILLCFPFVIMNYTVLVKPCNTVVEAAIVNAEDGSLDIPSSLQSFAYASVPVASKEPFPTTFIFPSIEERVQFYMGSWYEFNNGPKQTLQENQLLRNKKKIDPESFCDVSKADLNSKILDYKPTIYSLDTLLHRNKMPTHWLSDYLKDVTNVLTHSDTKIFQEYHDERYVILSIGDKTPKDESKPIVSKARKVVTREESKNESYQPIIWPIRMNRHFHDPLSHLQTIVQNGQDTKWEDKKNVVHWRGGGNTGLEKGSRLVFSKTYGMQGDEDGVNIGIHAMSPENKRRYNVSRCEHCFKPEQEVKTMLQYKYLLSLEGNDVATDLKWKLASSSVVFMPKPETDTYMMESKLVPYVHYVPVKGDGSDLLKQLRWAKDNDEQCKWISEKATEYMDKLYQSDQAKKDDLWIRHRLATLYQEKFGKALRACF